MLFFQRWFAGRTEVDFSVFILLPPIPLLLSHLSAFFTSNFGIVMPVSAGGGPSERCNEGSGVPIGFNGIYERNE